MSHADLSQIAIKDRMITELTIENRRLKEDVAKTHYAKFRVEQDLLCNFYIFLYML